MLLRDIKIKDRLLFGFGTLILLMVVFGIFALDKLRNVSNFAESIYRHPLTVNNAVRDIRAGINAMHRSMKDVALAENISEIEEAAAVVARLEGDVLSQFDIVFDRFLGDRTDVQNAFDSFLDWRIIREEVITLRIEGRINEAASITKGKGARHVDLMSGKIQKMIDFAGNKADEFLNNAIKEKNSAIDASLLFLITILIVSVVMAYNISKSIVLPLRMIANNLNNLSEGKLNNWVNYKSKNIIGVLCEAFRVLQDDLLKKTIVAEKIAKGDMSEDIIPRSENDNLGKSFYEMTTSLRRVTEELKNSEEQMRLITDAVPVLISYIDSDLRYQFNNKPYEVWFGHSKDFIKGKSMNSLLGEAAVKAVKEYIDRVMSGETVSFETTIPYSEGGTRFVKASYIPHYDDSDTIRGFFALVDDITERKEMEDQLRIERDRAQSYLDIAKIMILAIDSDGFITMINQKGCEILGHDEEELLGKNWFDTCTPQRLRKDIKSTLQDLMSGNQDYAEEFENPVITKDGQERLVSWHISLIRNIDGKITGLLSSGEDITERKRAEKALRDSEENMRDLIYVASHDLQTPIISLVGYSSKILDKYADSLEEDGIHALERLKKNAEKMHALVISLLDLSRLNTVDLNMKQINTNRVVSGVLMDLELQIKENNVLVNLSDLPTVMADPDRINTIFRNLISNAINYHGKTIDISCSDGVFVVKDDGIGISRRNLKKIFRPGERIKKIDIDGSGMGLAICRKIITKHDGRIWAESEGEGQGAAFKFELEGR